MKHLSSLIVSTLSISLFACGGDGSSNSGISDSTKLSSISQSEAESLCYEMVDLWPEREVTCFGQTFKLGLTDADCSGAQDPTAVDPTCTATVGDARACLRALAALSEAQICSGTGPAACAAIDACSEDDSERESSTMETFANAHAILSRM